MKTWLKIFYRVPRQLSEYLFPFAETDTGFYYLLGVLYAFYFSILYILYNTDESIIGPLLMNW